MTGDGHSWASGRACSVTRHVPSLTPFINSGGSARRGQAVVQAFVEAPFHRRYKPAPSLTFMELFSQ